MALIDMFLARAFKRGELTVTLPNGTTRTYGQPTEGLPAVAIRFLDNKVIRDILRDPALGAGEAFMDGRLVIERGDVFDFVNLAKANSRYEDGANALKASRLRRLAGRLGRGIATRNAAARSKRNVAHHYDLSDRLYDLFLDADRQYSCAYYTGDPATETLEQAQADKKAHIAAKLALSPGMRVLDIGCGWGGMALYLHAKTGADVTGVTLSEEQLKVARARAEAAGVADHVRFELIDYRNVTGTFDRIVSVGMFEHVGPANYPAFFRKVRDLLAPDGVALIHTIGRANGPGFTDAFTTKYIFPGGYNPALSEILEGSNGLNWYVTDVEVLRLHYAHTLKAWYDRTVAAREAIVALYDERFFRMWTFYLSGAWAAFAHGSMVNYQVQFSRNRHTLPITRDYMMDEERRLRGE
jgi:cyclopropane-fatty-acyl-phospholipid synthase